MTTASLIVATVQHACDPDLDTNLELSLDGVRRAAEKGAQLVVLQELHRSQYFCQVEDPRAFDLAETIPGPTTRRLGQAARELGVVVVASVFERRAAGVYHNTAVVLEKTGDIAGIYRKMHIPDDPGFYEKYYFTPGDLGFVPVSTSVGRLGVLVCWDQWFPEAARMMALAGAEALVYPTAIGWDMNDTPEERQRQKDAWRTVQRGHAVANGLPVVVCNRVGTESVADSSIVFWGGSFIAGVQGEILAEAEGEETVLMGVVDRSDTERVRRIWPFLRDRRVDAYGEIVKLYRD